MRRHGFIAGFLGLHRLVASAFLSVLLPAGPLGVGLVGKACAGEPAETPPVESIQRRSTTPPKLRAAGARGCTVQRN